MEEGEGFIALASLNAPEHRNERLTGEQNVARGLGRLLVMTRALCHQSLYCQWQSAGPELAGLHTLFEQHYQSLRKAIDVLAGRISELGYEPPSQFAKPAWGKISHDASPQKQLITSMIRRHLMCAREAKSLAETADIAGDEISAHIAVQRQTVHERSAWILTAIIDNKSTRSVM